jgi:methenyltetrahydrofolate cyclohydrolase
MLTEKKITQFLDELASNSPAPGGGSVAALAGSLGAALTSMVCNLTIGKKKYVEVENEMKRVIAQSEELRRTFTRLIDQDTDAFNKVMEALDCRKIQKTRKLFVRRQFKGQRKKLHLFPLA